MAAAIGAADRSLCLVILISPLHMKSQQRVAPLCKWGSDRRLELQLPHVVSTPREVGRVVRSFTQLELLKAN
jgi:hypothetical protein